MAAYRYEALDAGGKLLAGTIEADTARQARRSLRAQGLLPSEVEPLAGARARNAPAAGRIRAGELGLLTRQMATLLESGLTVEQTLTALAAETSRPATRAVLAGVKAEIMNGATLAGALGTYPASFPGLYQSLVRSGEQSGALPTVLEHLADYLESRQALKQRTALALLYPTIVTIFAALIVIGLLAYVVPQIVEVFRHSRQALPIMTRALIATSDFLRSAGLPLAIAALIAFAAGRYALRRKTARRRWHRALLRLPAVGELIRSAESARFATTVSILVRGGVPLLAALESGRAALSNEVLRDGAEHAIARVRDGASLASALAAAGVFPPMLVHLVAGGEATGALAAMLDRAAGLANAAFDRRLAVLVTLLEPALIVAMGLLVLAIVMSILLPIVSLNQLVR